MLITNVAHNLLLILLKDKAHYFDSLSNDKILDWFKLKAFTENKTKCYPKTDVCF